MKLIEKYKKCFKGSGIKLTLSVILSCIQAVTLLAIPLLIRFITKSGFNTKQVDFWIYGLLIIGLYFLQFCTSVYAYFLATKVHHKVILSLQALLFKYLYKIPIEFYSQKKRSKLFTILTQDVIRIDIMGVSVIARLLPACFICPTLGVLLIYFDPFLALLSLTIIPIIFMVNKVTLDLMSTSVERYHRSYENFNDAMYYQLRSMYETRIYGTEDYVIDESLHQAQTFHQRSKWLATLKIARKNLFYLLLGCFAIGILIAGGIRVNNNLLSIADLLAFFASLSFLGKFIIEIPAVYNEIIEGEKAIRSIQQNLLDSIKEPYRGGQVVGKIESIAFHNVSFGFAKGDALFKKFSFNISRQQMVALKGNNGTGKTTLSNLLLGFYKPWAGDIYVNEISYDKIALNSLQNKIGVVAQNPFLFNGTIRANITLGRTVLSEKAFENLLQKCFVNDILSQSNCSLDMVIGEEGTMLSGGQCQRIALARALYDNPDLLIFDEPDTYLDTDTIQRLKYLFLSEKEQRAILCITHNQEIIEVSDKVLNLNRISNKVDQLQSK